jgi:predicted ATPase
VQDAAYGTLLREPRRTLHADIAGTIESQFAEIAENQPEVLARHCSEAGQIEKSAALWSKTGQRETRVLRCPNAARPAEETAAVLSRHHLVALIYRAARRAPRRTHERRLE